MFFRKVVETFSPSRSRRPARGKSGARAYAVGDVHGCLDLLDRLLRQIELDAAGTSTPASLVFLGDLIDRGPDSAGVIERLRRYAHPDLRPVFLSGNHEEYFLRVLACEPGVLDAWLAYGGRECVQSYGLDPDQLVALPEAQALMRVREAVPEEHRRFVRGFHDTYRFGDYLFVHAGIRPGLALENQVRADLRWIREPFLEDTGDHGFVVVHGHTIVDEVDERPNRIGIDTGAYRSGLLTALVIEGADRRLLSVTQSGQKVSYAGSHR